MPAIAHGGDLAAARAAFPDAPAPWIDLSTGINPVAWPVPSLPPEAWTRLPEPAAVARLEVVAAAAYGAVSPTAVVAAPGTQALIQLLPRVLAAGGSGRRVGVLGPTYAEHAEVWRAAGAAVATVTEPAALAGLDVGVVVNPNNPDGRLFGPAALAALAARVATLVVDEAFMDVMRPGASLIPTLPANAVVLRSFGKAYGLAGLRLGFAVADAASVAALRTALGPWAVSGPAIAVGAGALADTGWLGAAIDRLEADAVRLDDLLAAAGFALLGGTPLFRLAAHGDAPAIFHRLGAAGILVRRFAEAPERLRFGMPADAAAWRRLAAVLGPQQSPSP